MPRGIRNLLLAALTFALSVAHAQTANETWVTDALRLTGESEWVRQRAMTRLRHTPDIERKLLAAIETEHRSLALDVISVLGYRDLLPSLIPRMDKDRDGRIHLTLNALINPSSREFLVGLYRKEIENRNLSSAALIALLDGLGLMSEPILPSKVHELLQNPSFEVRSAALLYATVISRKLRTSLYLPAIRTALESHPLQLRIQAIHSTAALPEPLKTAALPYLVICENDVSAVVRATCGRVSRLEGIP